MARRVRLAEEETSGVDMKKMKGKGKGAKWKGKGQWEAKEMEMEMECFVRCGPMLRVSEECHGRTTKG